MMRRVFAISAAAVCALFGAARADTLSAVTADDLAAMIEAAGLTAETAQASEGEAALVGRAGEIFFVVRALDCGEEGCAKLLFFANFPLNRPAGVADYRIINDYNDRNLFGRAYVIEARRQVGVDYVIELDGGVSREHVTRNIARWSDVVNAFVASFAGDDAGA